MICLFKDRPDEISPRAINAHAAILSFTLQRKCLALSVLKALNVANVTDKAAAFTIVFFSRLLSESSPSLLSELFEQLRARASGGGASDVVLAIEIFFQRHMRRAADGNEKLEEGVRLVLALCRQVALEV
jgi:hypothetical protein